MEGAERPDPIAIRQQIANIIYSYPNSTMDNATLFSVRTEAAERIRVAMEQHKLPKDDVGGYRYNHAVTLVENIEGVLEDQYFENATDG